MTPLEYIRRFYPEALKVERETGISAVAMLAQSAGESGWRPGPGNMMFGIKDTDGVNGNEQLVRTKEYHCSPGLKYPVIHSVIPVKKGNVMVYEYDVETWFRKYDNPANSFRDYARFIFANPRYKKALAVREIPELYLKELAKAGYATGPDYEEFMMQMLSSVVKRLKSLK
ncbi:MAG: glycoside hydrolase family 73 protein [Draconibacterium sp.]